MCGSLIRESQRARIRPGGREIALARAQLSQWPYRIDLVRVELESLREKRVDRDRARRELEDSLAGATTEVVVVDLAGKLVAGALPRELDRDQPSLLREMLDRAVDRRDRDTGRARLGDLGDLVGAQRPAGLHQGAANGLSLIRLPDHRSRLTTAERGRATVLSGARSGSVSQEARHVLEVKGLEHEALERSTGIIQVRLDSLALGEHEHAAPDRFATGCRRTRRTRRRGSPPRRAPTSRASVSPRRRRP